MSTVNEAPEVRTMQQQQTKYTYQDYLLLPDDERVELIEGEFIVASAPDTRHQIAVRNISSAL